MQDRQDRRNQDDQVCLHVFLCCFVTQFIDFIV